MIFKMETFLSHYIFSLVFFCIECEMVGGFGGGILMSRNEMLRRND